jgi:glycosyltransferase involved in cell wall biosynthesis
VTPPDATPSTHLVLIPSYNTGGIVLRTVRQACAAWPAVWVVVDGSTDGTDAALMAMVPEHAGLRVIVLPRNAGKGAAVLHGMRLAAESGFTHALTFDADGQHPACHIARFMAISARHPQAVVLGTPVFAADAPALRVKGRRISNWWARLETGGAIEDSLFGFRVYPVADLMQIMARTRWMRRFDFEPEAAVRLCWAGVVPLNVPAPVQYLSPAEGGVSHFRYGRDNLLLTVMHIRLMLTGLALHLPTMLHLRRPPAGTRI